MTPKQLQAILTKADLSLSQMAEYLCVSERTIRRYEDGTRNPGAPVVKLYGLLGEGGGQESTGISYNPYACK